MNIKKPNSFARYGNDYVAPLTTIDQIVKPSGERYTDKEFELMSNVENVMFGENSAGKNLINVSDFSNTETDTIGYFNYQLRYKNASGTLQGIRNGSIQNNGRQKISFLLSEDGYSL